ncbi:15214_t:CDS:1, partial [Cetraspora pellucida]
GKSNVALDDKENANSSRKRKSDDEENIDIVQKKIFADANSGKITEFVLDILGELEEIEKGDKKKILKLAIDENEYITKFWNKIKTEERKIQRRKFVQFTSLMFDV